MLLEHPWMKPLQRPATITEDAEAEDAATDDHLANAAGKLDLDGSGPTGFSPDGDAEIAAWVRGVLELKKQGKSGALPMKPALHTAPLDSMSPAASPNKG
jgi:mitogen-activated protein kinase kinase